LIGCQNTPVGPLDVVIVGNKIAGNDTQEPYQKWEYMELAIVCLYEDPPCYIWPEDTQKYQNRASILNIFGEQGWEVISFQIYLQVDLRDYLLKRPIFN
jgi:hypothetical protein